MRPPLLSRSEIDGMVAHTGGTRGVQNAGTAGVQIPGTHALGVHPTYGRHTRGVQTSGAQY